MFFTFVSCRCPHHHKSALLNLFSNRSSLSSWRDDGSDCCRWEGITCDHASGHVIGLDLTNRSISASINHSVFTSLTSLRFLNLSYNDFGNSTIPSNLASLSNLTHLNLSHSRFAGQIPATIGRMTNLVVLDFSSTSHFGFFDDLSYYDHGNNLKLEEPSAAVLLRNLSRLTKLHLDGVNISSTVPQFLSNFTRLTSLSLSHCNLVGEFPATIFQMTNLETLDVSSNWYLNGSFPDFSRESALRALKLFSTSFSGEIPPSLLNITKLAVLILYNNNFSTQLDSWKSNIGDHGGLRHLEILDLGGNSLHGTIL